MNTTDGLQKAGGISALIAAVTYLFAMALVFTILAPMADSSLSFEKYMDFYKANKTIIFIWHFAMYLISGVCLVILALALYERLESDAPTIIKIATVLGLIWASFVFLSGFIVLYGAEMVVNLNRKNPVQAETLKNTIETITLGIDYSDRFLGCLWVGLVSIAGFKTSTFPKLLTIFGVVISTLGLIGTVIPQLSAISYAFGMGAIVWWLGLGVILSRKQI
jgi:Domain of unknown function (DUF4386)